MTARTASSVSAGRVTVASCSARTARALARSAWASLGPLDDEGGVEAGVECGEVALDALLGVAGSGPCPGDRRRLRLGGGVLVGAQDGFDGGVEVVGVEDGTEPVVERGEDAVFGHGEEAGWPSSAG